MNITAEGVQVAGELAAFHMVHRSVYMKDQRGNMANYGKPLPYWFSVSVSDGTLDITFDGTDDLFWDRMDVENRTSPPNSYLSKMSTGGTKQGGQNPPYRFIGGPHTFNSVLGLEIFPPRLDLITVGPTGLALDPSVTNSSVISAVGDYNTYTTQMEYDSLEKVVREMLHDHETGDYTDHKALEELLGHLQGNLDADVDPVQLHERREGLVTLLSRDPTDQTLWELLNQTERLRTALDLIFDRVETGKNHFIENSKAISILWSFQPGDALFHSAEMWRARALYMLDPHRWVSSSGTAADIMEALRPHDPDNPYITMYRDTVPGGDRIWKEGQRVITTTGKVDHWTKAEVTEGWEGAPQWARWLREELYWLYDITDWWVLNRQQPDGALGGGWSDDVEFIGLFGFDALISHGADDLSLVGARRFVDGMLASGGVDLERGYSAALADAEHTAEWTGDSLPMMIAVDYGNPKWIEFSYKTGVLMRDLWMDETDHGHLHFKSNYLSATRIGGPNTAEDAYINYRAALPAHWVGWYNGDPYIEEIFIDWATAWVEDAMRTDDGKPRGVFPASVGFEGDELGGHNSPNWYTAQHPQGTVNYDWQPQRYRGYLEELVRGAYEATGNESLLEPFRLEAELAQAYLDDPVPNPTPGSAEWAGKVLGSRAVQLWDQIRIDYGIEGGGGMSGEPNGYSPEDVIGMTRMGRRYIDMCLPLMTTEASATDRVAFVGIINPFMIYTGGGVGGALLAPKVTYTGLGRDFAACVMDARPSGIQVMMYGFHHGTKDAGLVLWELENGGIYEVIVGDDLDDDGVVDVVDYNATFRYLTKGQEVPIELEGDAEKLVVVRQVENGTDVRWLLPDLALVAEEIYVDPGNGLLRVPVHNIGGNTSGDYVVVVEDADLADTVLARIRYPAMEAPKRLNPNIAVNLLGLSKAPVSGNITVRIEPYTPFMEITTLNNEVTVSINSSLLEILEPPVYVGPEDPEPLVVQEDDVLDPPVPVVNMSMVFEPGAGTGGIAFSFEIEPDVRENVTFEVIKGVVYITELASNWNGGTNLTVRCMKYSMTPGVQPILLESPPFPIIVMPVNDPPEYIGTRDIDWVLNEDWDLTEPHVLLDDLASMFSDVDGDELSIGFDYRFGSENATVNVEGNELHLTWLKENWSGTVDFRLNASDAGDDGVAGNGDDLYGLSGYFPLIVEPVNDAPTVVGKLGRHAADQGETLEIDLAPYFDDVDGDELFFEIGLDPEGIYEADVTSDDETDHLLVLTPVDVDFYGYINVSITCFDRDPAGSAEQPLNVSTSFLLEVKGYPYVPSAPRNLTIQHSPSEPLVGDLVNFSATADLDPKGVPIEFLWRLDGHLMIDYSPVEAFNHTFDEAGNYNVSVRARYEGGPASEISLIVKVQERTEEPQDPDPEPEPEDGPSPWLAGLAIGVVIVLVLVFSVVYLRGRKT
jgi:hypothetical protein